MTPIEIKCILFATFACAAPFPATQKHYPFGLLKQHVALEKDIRCKCRASQFWSLYPGSDIVLQLQILVTSFPPFSTFSTFSSSVCQPAHSCGFLLFYFWLSFDYAVFIRIYCRLCFSTDCAPLFRCRLNFCVACCRATMHEYQ